MSGQSESHLCDRRVRTRSAGWLIRLISADLQRVYGMPDGQIGNFSTNDGQAGLRFKNLECDSINRRPRSLELTFSCSK